MYYPYEETIDEESGSTMERLWTVTRNSSSCRSRFLIYASQTAKRTLMRNAFIDRLKSIISSRREPEEIDRLPSEWKLRDMNVQIVALPTAVNGPMLVKIVYIKGNFKVDRDKIWSMTMTPLITHHLYKIIDKHKITDPKKLHGALLVIRHLGPASPRRFPQFDVVLEEDANVDQ